MERTSSVRSDWNIWEHLWRWSTLAGPVISVGPTELSFSILTKLFSLVPLFCILLTRTITRRAVAWVGSVQTECAVLLGTWALLEWKAPEMSNFDGSLTYQVRPGNGPSLDPSKRKFLSLATTSPQTASSSPRSRSDITHHTWSRLTKKSYFCLIFLCMSPSLACEYSRFSLLPPLRTFRHVPSGEEQGETAVFAGYSFLGLPIPFWQSL